MINMNIIGCSEHFSRCVLNVEFSLLNVQLLKEPAGSSSPFVEELQSLTGKNPINLVLDKETEQQPVFNLMNELLTVLTDESSAVTQTATAWPS